MEAHSGLNAVALSPLYGHRGVESHVNGAEFGAGKNRRCLISGCAASFDNDPGEIIWDEHEGVHHTCEVEGLECANEGRGDGHNLPGILHAVLSTLLQLNPLQDAVGARDLLRVGVRPWPDQDPVAAHHHPAAAPDGGATEGLIMPQTRRRRPRRLKRETGEANRGDGRRGEGVGDEEEEEEAGNAEAKDEADEAADAVHEKPKSGCWVLGD